MAVLFFSSWFGVSERSPEYDLIQKESCALLLPKNKRGKKKKKKKVMIRRAKGKEGR